MDSASLEKRGIKSWIDFSSAAERITLAGLPTSFGVYVILLGREDQRLRGTSDIAYIGKATNRNGLRGRIRQYFHPGPTQSTNIAMRQRLCADGCQLKIGFAALASAAEAIRLESDLLLEFEREHGELPPYNRQRALDLLSRTGEQ